MAYHDELTGLPNRAMLKLIQQKAISHAMRTQQLKALMFIDLDGFKPVNDTLGHRCGDQLLAAVGERLRASIRQSDTIARVGGDEFAMLVTGLDKPETAATLAHKLLDSLARPFALRGQRIEVRASIGIAKAAIATSSMAGPERVIQAAAEGTRVQEWRRGAEQTGSGFH
jgi:diguanylate cyclase (GGDEF)-like protein